MPQGKRERGKWIYKEQVVEDEGMVRLHNDPKSYFFRSSINTLNPIVSFHDAIAKYSTFIVITRRYNKSNQG